MLYNDSMNMMSKKEKIKLFVRDQVFWERVMKLYVFLVATYTLIAVNFDYRALNGSDEREVGLILKVRMSLGVVVPVIISIFTYIFGRTLYLLYKNQQYEY